MSKIVAYLKDGDGKRYKIEKYRGYATIISNTDYYGILYNDGDVYAKDFKTYDEAVRYLERRVGNVKEY